MSCNRELVAEERVETPKAYFGSTVRKTGGMK